MRYGFAVSCVLSALTLFGPIAAAREPVASGSGLRRFDMFEAFTVPEAQVDAAYMTKLEEEAEYLKSLTRRETDATRRAEYLHRLAEIYWRHDWAAHHRKMAEYDREFNEWVEKKRNVKPVPPKFTATRVYNLLSGILRTAPSYERRDEVLFRAGYLARDVDASASLNHHQELVKSFPRSPLRLDAFLAIGNMHFEARRLDEAVAAYRTVLREPSRIYNFALYKLAWCHYNQGKTRTSMELMQKVVQASRGVRHEIELREEALRDLVVFYSDLGLIDEAQEYFNSIGEASYGFTVVEKLAEVFFSQSRYAKVEEAVRRLLAGQPFDPRAPRRHSRLIEAYEKSQQLPRAMKEMEVFLDKYREGSLWHTRNPEAEAREYAHSRSESYARFTAKKFHEFAQKAAASDPEESAKFERLALAHYKRYLELFGNHENSYEMRFLYADLLFKNKRHAEAAAEYEKAAAFSGGERRREAFLGQLDALNHIEEAHFKDLQDRGVKTRENLKPIPVSPHARKLMDVDEAFVKAFPKDTKVPEVMLQRARLLYNYNEFGRARPEFLRLISAHPRNEASHTARHLILDILNLHNDWENLEVWATKFLGDRAFATPDNKALLLQLIEGSIFKRAEALSEKRQHGESAEMYMRLIRNHPGSEFAEKALYNTIIEYIRADDGDQATKASKLFQSKYPLSKLIPQLMVALASYFDDKLDYAQAAAHYEAYARSAPKGAAADAALFNAGLYRENLKEYDRAIANYNLYLERHPDAKDAPEVFFSTGLIHEKRRRFSDAAEVFYAFPRRYGARQDAKARVVESHYRFGQSQDRLRRPDEAVKAYGTAVRLHSRYSGDPGLGPNIGGKYAALAAFELTRDRRREFDDIRLRMPQAAMARALTRKAELLKQLREDHLSVINYGDAETGVRALYEIGVIYQSFSEALFRAPIPKELDPEEVQIYQQELADRATPIEAMAVEAFENAVSKAFELNIYNEWTRRAYERLTQFKPDVYPPIRGALLAEPAVSHPVFVGRLRAAEAGR